MISDTELDRIIALPRNCGMEINGRFESNNLLAYFNTMGVFEPSWKFMEPVRMMEIFEMASSKPWFNDNHRRMISEAIKLIR